MFNVLNEISNKLKKITAIIFGTIVLIFGLSSIYANLKTNKLIISTNGTVSRIKSYEAYDNMNNLYMRKDIYIKYTIDTKQYEGKIDDYKGLIQNGDNIKIYYHLDTPQKIEVKNPKAYDGFLITFVGICMILIGVFVNGNDLEIGIYH